MKLIKFSIENYKSIQNSNECWLASDITILAGKNECGKTACLEAIRDFHPDILDYAEPSLPMGEDNSQPIVHLWFELSAQDSAAFFNSIGLKMSEEIKTHIAEHYLKVSKHEDSVYWFSEEVESFFQSESERFNCKARDDIQKSISTLTKLSTAPVVASLASEFYHDMPDDVEDAELSAKVENLSIAIKAQLAGMDQTSKDACDKFFSASEVALKNLDRHFASDASDKIKSEIPRIVYYSSYGDLLPFEVSLENASNSQAVKDFAKIANLDLQALKDATDAQKKKFMTDGCSAKITGDFKEFWQQDEILLTVWLDGDTLHFGIKEAGKIRTLKPQQRSQGFQWFLSFYLRLKAEGAYEEGAIILIDEPGLYLHADAQSDVLKVLKDLSKKAKIIISTHSPYMIDPTNLSRVRIVQKGNKGTVIENKITKNVEKDALKPIITAIGFDISKSLTVAYNDNVLTEGITDYYYLSAFASILKRAVTYAIIPGTGATQVPNLASIFMGWGLNFVAVFDNDSEGKKAAKLLLNDLSIEKQKVIHVLEETTSGSIEDMFTSSDFGKFVLKETIKNGQSNSDLVNKADKVLKAKKFFEDYAEPGKASLDKDTLQNFSLLFDKIDNALGKSSKKISKKVA